jgi:hypothetical protein
MGYTRATLLNVRTTASDLSGRVAPSGRLLSLPSRSATLMCRTVPVSLPSGRQPSGQHSAFAFGTGGHAVVMALPPPAASAVRDSRLLSIRSVPAASRDRAARRLRPRRRARSDLPTRRTISACAPDNASLGGRDHHLITLLPPASRRRHFSSQHVLPGIAHGGVIPGPLKYFARNPATRRS